MASELAYESTVTSGIHVFFPCSKCGMDLDVGSTAVEVRKGKDTIWYHKACYETISTRKQTPELTRLKRNARKSLHAIADELEAMARRALWKLAETHKGKIITFVSAMGTYSFGVETYNETPERRNYFDVKPPCIRAFDEVASEFGYAAIPAPLYLAISPDGEFTRKTDW